MHVNIAFTLLLLVTCPVVGAAILKGPTVNPTNGHIYLLVDDSSWQAGEATAITYRGHLVTINDLGEQQWVFTTFGTVAGVHRSLWIGLKEVGTEGNYVWTSGEPRTYTNWYPNEPNNGGGESFVHMIRTDNGFNATPGTWNDLKSPNTQYAEFNPMASVIEIVPPTLTIGTGTQPPELRWPTQTGWNLYTSTTLADDWVPYGSGIQIAGPFSVLPLSTIERRRFFRLQFIP